MRFIMSWITNGARLPLQPARVDPSEFRADRVGTQVHNHTYENHTYEFLIKPLTNQGHKRVFRPLLFGGLLLTMSVFTTVHSAPPSHQTFSTDAGEASDNPASLGQVTRAELITPVRGHPTQSQPQPAKIRVTEGPAKGCIIDAYAFLNTKRMRYEYRIEHPFCVVNGKTIKLGSKVRGQHRILGTMANSGLGRDYLLSKKGLGIVLSEQ